MSTAHSHGNQSPASNPPKSGGKGKVISIRPSQAAKSDQVESPYYVPGHDAKGHGSLVRMNINPGHERRIFQIVQRPGNEFAGKAGFIRWAIKEALDRFENDPELRGSEELQTAVNSFDRDLGDLHYLTLLMQRKNLVREVYDQYLMDRNYQAARDHVRQKIAEVGVWPEGPSKRDFLDWLHREFDGELEQTGEGGAVVIGQALPKYKALAAANIEAQAAGEAI